MSEDAPKPQSTRRADFLPEAYAHYLNRVDRTLLDKAKQMLRDEFIKQPLLTVYFSGEPWRQPLIAELVNSGYLGPRPMMYWPYELPECHSITALALAELRDVGICTWCKGPCRGGHPYD